MLEPGSPILREIDSPLAKELGEIQLITQDIETAFRAIDLWRKKYAPKTAMTPKERTVCLALFRDAVVQFVGCFDKNSKYSLRKESVYTTDDQIAYFDWLQDLRDSYAAHQFGPYRQCVVGVNLSGPSRRIEYINQLYRGPNLGDQLQDFISIAGTYSAFRMKELTEKLLRSLDSVTDEELSALPIAKTHQVGLSEVRMSRAAFRRVQSGKGPANKRSRRPTTPVGG
jgi:hypothetical protein